MADFEIHSLTVIGKEEFQDGPERNRSVNIQRCIPLQHSEGGKEREQPEKMVSVYVGKEQGIDPLQRHMAADQLLLAAFTAVNQEKAPI